MSLLSLRLQRRGLQAIALLEIRGRAARWHANLASRSSNWLPPRRRSVIDSYIFNTRESLDQKTVGCEPLRNLIVCVQARPSRGNHLKKIKLVMLVRTLQRFEAHRSIAFVKICDDME